MLLLGLGTQAQNWRDAPKFIMGVRAGMGVSSHDDSDVLASATVGLSLNFRIAKLPFYVETGAYYENMGYRRDGIGYNDNALVVPAVLSYHIHLKKDMSIQPFMGPSLIYGFDSKEFDYGFRAGCGFNKDKFYASLGFDTNLTKDYGDDFWSGPNDNPVVFYATVGVNF